MKSDSVGILFIDVYKSTYLKAGEKQADIDATFKAFHDTVDCAFGRFGGARWHSMGDGAIFTFQDSGSAVGAAVRLLGELTRFDSIGNKLSSSLHVRIGIHEGPRAICESVPQNERGKLAVGAIDVAGKLEKNCPVGKIAVSPEVYRKLENVQRALFRQPAVDPQRPGSAFVLEYRNTMPRERALGEGLTDDQLRRLPPTPFRAWEKLQPHPDTSLRALQDILHEPLLVVLGESSIDPSSSVRAAATSDAVGAIEIMATIRASTEVTAGIDRWADTADIACDRSLMVVGSGVVNTYAFAFNDLVRPVHFAKAEGRVFDQILAETCDGRRVYGSHAAPPRDCGFAVILRSPVNPDKHVVWIAGITGMGTQAAARFAWDIVTDPDATLRERLGSRDFSPIACVVAATTPSGSTDISALYRRWRIADYIIVLAIDREGRAIQADMRAA